MGIPSYFSYIIKNYTNIIRKFHNCEKFHCLFMDCNSIIYDSYYELEEIYNKTPFDISTIEEQLIQKVISKIEYYIDFISPSNSVYVTFDGVAPFAKMDQQRLRRYKTQFMSKLANVNKIWNTSAITPGTQFMDMLNRRMKHHFKNNSKNNSKIIISGSDEPGEGEHKIFKYIRENNLLNENIAIYGLDSDLIMLSIFHKQFTKKIYVFREAPNFKSILSNNFNKNEKLFMDIYSLCSAIQNEMNNGQKVSCIYDYIFMCFLLGNDFLPHFPSLNIRTHGFQILLDTYFNIIGKHEERCFIDNNNNIQWNFVYLFLNEISKNEKEYIINEYVSRDVMDNRCWSSSTPSEIEQLVSNIPIIYRQDEKYICPREHGWEKRYYKVLFDIIPTEEEIKKICINYLEGLEWVFKYYTKDCPDWKWRYNYHYPPLIKDLIKYIPKKEKEFIMKSKEESYHPKTQLAYVLPYENLDLLGEKDSLYIRENYAKLYPFNYEFKWAFKRYMWESEAVLPEITKEVLEIWDDYFIEE
jgi:5'-3' exonuclease